MTSASIFGPKGVSQSKVRNALEMSSNCVRNELQLRYKRCVPYPFHKGFPHSRRLHKVAEGIGFWELSGSNARVYGQFSGQLCAVCERIAALGKISVLEVPGMWFAIHLRVLNKERSLDVPWMFTGCALDVHWMFTGCSLDVHWMFTGCSLDVHWMFAGCSLDVHWCSLDVPWMCPGCSLDVHWMSTGCPLDVHWMFTGCALDVHWLFTGCSLDVHWTFASRVQ
jgi:hypothetical protein